MQTTVCILAAGQGKRMYSNLPKVLHPLGGKPLLAHVMDAARCVSSKAPVVIYGHGGEQVREAFAARGVEWVAQTERLGTGHAVLQALPKLPPQDLVVILYGDVPLLGGDTLAALVRSAARTGFALLTVEMDDPSGYGRIVRGASGNIVRIVEHKDAHSSELDIAEINTGIMAIRAEFLHAWLPRLSNNNAQGEYYLTDCVEMAVTDGVEVTGVHAHSATEVTGVNNRVQLAELERAHQRAVAVSLLEAGVTLHDPARLDVRGELECGRDCVIDVNCIFIGRVTLGENVRIGANCVISDTEIGDNSEILPNCVIEAAKIGAATRLGPFARLRPEVVLADEVRIGNFVEVKKSTFGRGSKANHLAYVGDAEIGRKVNVGAGTITCNYDGANKHKTVIDDDVFIGSDTQLVAPVKVGRGVTIGAGTTVTDDVDADLLVVSRVRQKTISGWKRPTKNKK